MGAAWGVIIPLAIIAGLLLIILGVIFFIKYKLQKVSMEAFGTKDIIKGFKNTQDKLSETPKTVRAMTSIYLPEIHRDFPEFDYELYREKAKSVLRGYFSSIAKSSTSHMTEECSVSLKNHVQGIIDDLNMRAYTQHFEEVVIHSMEIARYIKNGATVNIIFNSAVGLYNYITDSDGKVCFGSKDRKTQTIYTVELVYVQDASKMVQSLEGDAVGINCPNCGAPIRNLGFKFCEYCGSGIVEVNTRSWEFDAVHEETKLKTAY